MLNTQVCILGAGPAGLALANMLLNQNIDCIVVDAFSRAEIYARGRAGLIECTTVSLLDKHHLASTIYRNGTAHDRCEFRTPNFNYLLEYGKIAGGETHYTYPQNDLVDDLAKIYLDAGGVILYSTPAERINQNEAGAQVECREKSSGEVIVIQSDFLVGCDGYHGISRQAVPNNAVKIYDKQHDYSWLAILAHAPPSSDHIIYALHPDGFAGHMLRNSKISRFYIQVALGDEIENWSDERIWAALRTRLAKPHWHLAEGEIFEKRILSMRSYVIEPLSYQRLFLVGDAAHIITPCGGKGMNLAIQDAGVLAETLGNYYRDNLELTYLSRYSELRLPYIWRAQEFSLAMLHMLHKPQGNDSGDVAFMQKIGESKLAQLRTSPTFALDFSRNYVGII
jgi:p-hydroxybenzoate 3-monooxygenase